MPRVTVLMPVHNGQPFLREAVESLLAQTYRDFELVVLDDGSTDGSRDAVASYRDSRIRLVPNETHQGLVPTLNRGLALARGELIARQDADDRSHPDRLHAQVRVFDQRPETALVGTQARVIDAEGRVAGVLDRSLEPVSIRWAHLFDNSFIHSSVMARRQALLQDGSGYEPLAHCEDYALWSKVALAHPVANLPQRLVDYRAHAGSVYGALSPEQAAVSAAGNRRIIQRNLDALFGAGMYASEEVELLSRFRLGLTPPLVGAFLALFHQLLAHYQAQCPESLRSADFKRTVARQYDEIAYKLSPSTRRLAIRVYTSGLLSDPALMWSLSWPRVLALTTLGQAGRSRLREGWNGLAG